MIPVALIPFLGRVAQKVAPQLLTAAIDTLVQSPDVPVSQENAPAVRDALGPLVRKIVGAGKWPLIFGGLGTLFSGLSGLFMALGNGEGDPEVYATSIGGIVSGISILIGLWKAGRAVK